MKQWTSDLQGRGGQRCYATEHILEWQLLQDFIEHDKDKKDQSVCAHLINWFLDPMPAGKHKVKVAKDEGKLKNDHFEYEDKDYELKPWNYKAQKPRYIEWICKYYPQYDARTTIPLRGSPRVTSYYLDAVHLYSGLSTVFDT